MARHTSDDYIPTEGEYEAQRQAMKQYQTENPDPRHSYKATYTISGKKYSEEVLSMNAEEAEAYVKQQWSLVGSMPLNIKIESMEN